MTRRNMRQRFALGWLLLATPALAVAFHNPAVAQTMPAASNLPTRISDADFWALVDSISEPGGYFQIADNFTSNEREIGQLYTMLRERGTQRRRVHGRGARAEPHVHRRHTAADGVHHRHPAPGGDAAPDVQVGLRDGAGPGRFHLRFSSRSRGPPGSTRPPPSRTSGRRSGTSPSDSAMWRSNYARMVDLLTRTHGFRFTKDESDMLKWVFDAFFAYGPVITTRAGSGGGGGVNQTTFADLTGYSNDASGNPRSFLSSEENYAYVKDLHARNLIVPVSGDFAGPKAIRAIGSWLQSRGAVVSAFYVSNVEQYLFRDNKAAAFYDNVATLPVNDASVFIRPYSLRRYGFSIQSLCPIGSFLTAWRAGQAPSNNAALSCPPGLGMAGTAHRAAARHQCRQGKTRGDGRPARGHRVAWLRRCAHAPEQRERGLHFGSGIEEGRG